MIKGVIFDMDGLIVDTEYLHCKSYLEVLKKYNIILSEKFYYGFWTQKGKGITDFVQERGLDLDPEKIREEKRDTYHKKLSEELRLYEGADEIIAKLTKNFPLALVTNSYRKDVDFILNLFNLDKYFKVIVTLNDIKNRKPHPEGFLLASQRLGIKQQQILVIEDAERGIIAAYEAGMKSIAIPNEYTRNNDFSLANIVLKSIKEVTFDLINSL